MSAISNRFSDREIINKWIVARYNPLFIHSLEKLEIKGYQANGLIGFAYVDHDTGISIRVFALCLIESETTFRVVVPMSDLKKDLILRYGSIDISNVLDDVQIKTLSLPSTPDWLKYYESPQHLKIRARTDLDQFRAPGYFDDVSVILISENQVQNPEIVWVRLEEIEYPNTFRGRLLNQPNTDFGVSIGECIPILLTEVNSEHYLVSGDWVL